jgi:ribosomal protein S18 acetylase RimI-like enzyme
VLRVRLARPGDEAEVAGVHVRSWQVGYRGLLPERYLQGLRAEDRRDRYVFASPRPEVVTTLGPVTTVAVEDGVICGFVTTGPSPDARVSADVADVPDVPDVAEVPDVPNVPGRGEVLALYVDPDAWGRGVGRRLMAEARRTLGDGGFAEAVLWVLVGNDRAQRFYRADGWRPDDRRRNVEVWGIAVEEIRYRRRLP